MPQTLSNTFAVNLRITLISASLVSFGQRLGMFSESHGYLCMTCVVGALNVHCLFVSYTVDICANLDPLVSKATPLVTQKPRAMRRT